MEFWINDRKVAFTMSCAPNYGFAGVGDVEVMEQHHIGVGDDDSPSVTRYKKTASFIVASDALIYLRGKYPMAEERESGRGKEVRRAIGDV